MPDPSNFFLPEQDKMIDEQDFNEWLKKFTSEKSMSNLSAQELSTRWLQIHRQLKDLEKEEKSLRVALTTRYQETNLEPFGIKITKTLRRGNIDYSNIPELKDVDLEKYRADSSDMYRISEIKVSVDE